MSEISSSSAEQKCLSWIAATTDWDFKSGETNQEVIFVGPEGNEESIKMQEDEEDRSLISDTESAIKGSPIIEKSDDDLNKVKNTVGKYSLEGSGDILAGRSTAIYMVEISMIGIVIT